MAFFEDLSRKVQDVAFAAAEKGKEVAAIASEKAQDAADTVKTNVAIAGEQRAIEKNYRAIGEWYVSELKGEAPEAVADIVAAIRASQARIAALQGEDAPVEAECADVTEAAPEAAPAEAPSSVKKTMFSRGVMAEGTRRLSRSNTFWMTASSCGASTPAAVAAPTLARMSSDVIVS